MQVRHANGESFSVRNDLGRELVRTGLTTVVEPEESGLPLFPFVKQPLH
jgi:hypothetical protein